MKNNDFQIRVNEVKEAFNSLTVEEFLALAQIQGFKQKGEKWRGNCPLHDSDSRSFTIYKKPEGIFYNCPTNCGSGTAFGLFAKLNNLGTKGRDFISVMNLLAARMGMPGINSGELTAQQLAEIEKRKKQRALERQQQEAEKEKFRVLSAQVFAVMFDTLRVEGAGLDYLVARGLNAKHVVKLDDLGVRTWNEYCLEELKHSFSHEEIERVLGPLDKLKQQLKQRPLLMFTHDGDRFTGFQARSVDPNCKKRFRFVSRGAISEGFFNGHQIAQNVKKIIMVEGMTDCIAEHCEGHELALIIGKSGAGRIGPKLAKKLSFCESVLVLFDDDEAGKIGSFRTANELQKAGCAWVEYQVSEQGDRWESLVN